jgi:hypothetical protein
MTLTKYGNCKKTLILYLAGRFLYIKEKQIISHIFSSFKKQ